MKLDILQCELSQLKTIGELVELKALGLQMANSKKDRQKTTINKMKQSSIPYDPSILERELYKIDDEDMAKIQKEMEEMDKLLSVK